MLPALIRFALSQRLLMLLLTVMLTAGGIHAFIGLPIDAFPDVSTTQVKIILKAPGMTPEEVETRIAVPVEQEMLGIPHQRLLRSVSKYALTDITIDFEAGTDIYWARQQVGERLASAIGNLPPGVGGGMAPITTPLGEVFMFTIEGELSLADKRALLDWVLRPQLRTIPGVADVNSLGGEVRTFEVVPDPQLLAARGLALRDLQAVLEANNRNDGAGRLRDGEEALLVRAEGAIQTLDDVRAIVLQAREGRVVSVGDVATVRFGTLTRYGAVTQSGQGEAVQGLVLGLRGANAQAVVDGVKERLAEIAPTLPEGVSIVPFYDRSNLVERAVGTVSKALFEAIVLVVLLLLAFLGNLRAALVVALMLPLSALATFILMRAFGLSANLMSLGGLAIAIGMLVDAAVVVVENVESQLGTGKNAAQDQLPTLHLVFRAAREVAAPVTSGIVIIILVFLPLLTLQGLEGKMFGPVALTIVFALSASLLLSLTVVPVLASWLIQRGVHHEPWLVRKLAAAYDAVLASALAHGRRYVAGALIALLAAAAAFGLLGKSFMPTMDEGDLIMQLEKLPSIGLEQTIAIDSRVQQAILALVPEVKAIVARAGFPGIGYSFTQPIDMRVSEMLTGVRGDLAIKLFGPDLATLNKLAVDIENTVKAVRGAEDTFTLKNDGVQYLKIAIDRLAAGRFGLNVDAVQNDLKALLEGRDVGTVIERGRRIPVVLRDLVGFVDDAKAAVARDVKLPDGYRLAWGGQFENQQRAAARLMVVVPIALALIFFLLFSTFHSVRQALLVLSNIPFAMIGGVFGLLIAGEYLSVPASVGFIALLGIAVLNGVVMVTYFNQLLARGMAVGEVVVEGAKRRLRPVLMTASIAAFGLVPMLFATGPGSEIQRPLAIVVIGGLLTSTVLTLVLLPILFRRFGVKPAVVFTEERHG